MVTTAFFIDKSEISEAIIRVDGENIVYGIGKDPANTDYQAFLAWVAEGNTPEPWNPAP